MPSSKVSPLLNLFSSLDWVRISNPRLTDSGYYSLQYGLLNRAAIIENIIVNVCNRFLRLKSVNTNRTDAAPTAKAVIAQTISNTLSARDIVVETVFITDSKFTSIC